MWEVLTSILWLKPSGKQIRLKSKFQKMSHYSSLKPTWQRQQSASDSCSGELSPNPSGCRGALIFLSSFPPPPPPLSSLLPSRAPPSFSLLSVCPPLPAVLLSPLTSGIMTASCQHHAISPDRWDLPAAAQMRSLSERSCAGRARPGTSETLLVRFYLFIGSLLLRCCWCFWAVFVFIHVRLTPNDLKP